MQRYTTVGILHAVLTLYPTEGHTTKGENKAHINRRGQRHSKHKTEKTHNTHKSITALEWPVKYFTGGLKPANGEPTSTLVQMWIKTHRCLVCMKDPKLINASSPRTYKSRFLK